MKVLVIGDSCIDVRVIVSTERINPEDGSVPLYTTLWENSRTPGMADNVAVALTCLGMNVTCISPREDLFNIAIAEKRRLYSVEGKYLARYDIDVGYAEYTLFELLRKFKGCNLNDFDAVVISDYQKGFVSAKLILMLEVLYDKPIFLDSKRTDLHRFTKCKIKINSVEATNQVNNYVLAGTVVTMGNEGAFVSRGQGKPPGDTKFYHAPTTKCVDVTGAGDAFLAGYVYGTLLNNGISPVIYGVCNGSISVGEMGTYSPSASELKLEVKKYLNANS